MAPFRVATRSDHHFQLAFFAPLQTVPVHEEVSGFRLNLLFGSNRAFEGLDVGVVNHVTEQHSGLGFGLVNISQGDAGGWRFGLANFAAGEANMMHFGADGLQVGVFNSARHLTGYQVGFVNHAHRSGFTSSRRAMQLGLLNLAGDLSTGGIQVGLLNFAGTGGMLPVMPVINGTF